MKANRLLAVLAIVAMLASCGVLKKTKHREKQEIETVVKRDCVKVESSVKLGEVKERSIDRGVSVTERTTTTITEKGGKSAPLVIKKGDLKPGENYLRDSAGIEVKAILDTLGRTLTIEVTAPVERSKTTVSERTTDSRDHTKDREEREAEEKGKIVAVTADSTRREVAEVADSVSKPSVWGILSNYIGWAVLVVILLVFLFWYFGIRRRK